MSLLQDDYIKWQKNVLKRKSKYWNDLLLKDRQVVYEIATRILAEHPDPESVNKYSVMKEAEKEYLEENDKLFHKNSSKMNDLMMNVDLERARENYEKAAAIEDAAWDSKNNNIKNENE